MERLTEKTVDCFEYALKDHKAVPGEFGTYDAFFDYSMAVKRLGHYENTGLEPEEIVGLKNTCDQLQGINDSLFNANQAMGKDLKEWKKAHDEGRLVVLPCKAGDHVWMDGREAIIEEFFGYETERYLHAQFYDNMQYIDIPFDEIGKTVFLTREEAEAVLALKGGEG